MPYLKNDDKQHFKAMLSYVPCLDHPGKLNYIITELCKLYLHDNGESYNTYNSIVGALECAKMELYRRKVSKYEDVKILENGDVYD